jgi:peroxiredoxin
MPGLGTPMPAFALHDVMTNRTVSSSDFSGAKAVLVMFICNHCPFVVHVKDELARLSQDYSSRGDVSIVGICSNDAAAHPDDAPERMKEMATREGWRFPYLVDASQEVAKAFGAACTPDFFLYGADRRLAYRGQLDSSRPRSAVPVTGADLRSALEAVLNGRPVTTDQTPSMGCNIKWRPGNEPPWFGG